MTSRTVKTLNKTGRIARKKASATAAALREAMVKSGTLSRKAEISRKTTATGRAKVAFHVSGKIGKARKSPSSDRYRSA